MRHTARPLILFAALPALAVATAPRSASADDFPQLGFEEAPSYYGEKQVSLTFDDGPGWAPQHTLAVLDELAKREVKATFFINTGNQATGIQDNNPDAVLAVKRIIDEGHELGTHTLNHTHLITLDEAGVSTEINGVDEMVHTLGLLPAEKRITLFRAPYGEPYQWKFQQDVKMWSDIDPGVEKYDMIAPIAAEGYVHVGWNIDSDDWKCSNDEAGGACLVENIVAKLEGRSMEEGLEGIVHRGNILMHSISARTAVGLPALLDYLDGNGFEIVPTEQAICNKYGATSKNVVAGKSGCDGLTSHPGDGDGDGDGDGSVGDGDGDGTVGDGDGEGDGDDGETVTIVKEGCSVGHGGTESWTTLGLLAVGMLALAGRRRARKS